MEDPNAVIHLEGQKHEWTPEHVFSFTPHSSHISIENPTDKLIEFVAICGFPRESNVYNRPMFGGIIFGRSEEQLQQVKENYLRNPQQFGSEHRE